MILLGVSLIVLGYVGGLGVCKIQDHYVEQRGGNSVADELRVLRALRGGREGPEAFQVRDAYTPRWVKLVSVPTTVTSVCGVAVLLGSM